MSKLQLKGSWNELKGKLKQRYANLTDCAVSENQYRIRSMLGLLRQRQVLRDAGRNPNQAHVRPPEIVENYEQK